jgi:hypothetical protein
MKNVKNWKKQSREKRQTPSATRENKQIKSGLASSVQSHPKQHQRSRECLQISPDEREAFIQKKGWAARRRGFNRD